MSIKTEHLSIAGVRFEPNKKLGYYTLGDQIFYNKNLAMLAGSKIPGNEHHNLNNDPVRWFFNEEDFIKYPWHIEPEEDIRELYRRRAQQLRDKYDYIRLELSGGADSATVAFAFLLNGIHLDEVVYRYPKGGDKNAVGNAWDTRSENHLSEHELAAKPLMNWIATHFPATKITVHDYLNDMIEQQSEDESWIYKTRNAIQPGHPVKHTVAASTDHKKLVDRDLKIAMIFGCDKPKTCIKDGKWFIYFQDPLANHNNADMGQIENVTTELFYWAPEGCDIMCKQAHMIRQWFEMPVHHGFQNIVSWPNGDYAIRTFYERLVRPIIYPDYDFNTFQTAKASNSIYAEMDTWFFTNFKDTKLFQVWESGINFLLDNLDQRYLVRAQEGKMLDLKQYMSPLYYLADSTIPPVGVVQNGPVLRAARNDQTRYIHCIRNKLVVY